MLEFQSDTWSGEKVELGAQGLPVRPDIPAYKWVFDRLVATVLLVPFALTFVILGLLNPFFNKGPMFYVQRRMGYGCRPFWAFKFRSMTGADDGRRGAFDALEQDRITRLGHWLRKMRIDELPQILNVLKGEMSLIGPRPDSYDHARVYLTAIPGYAVRHETLPGISGYAQTEVGYVDGLDGVRRKIEADTYYIRNASLRLDLWIAWRTVGVVLRARGA